MRKALILSAVLLTVASSAIMAADTLGRSFLNAPVGSVEQLSQQVANDAVVAARYAKHFHTSRSAVAEYFTENLAVGMLTQDVECTVYSISDKTGVVSCKMVLGKGTPVFLSADGRPMLVLATGNPLTSAMPVAGISPKEVKTGSVSASTDWVVTKVLGDTSSLAAAVADPVAQSVATTPVAAAPATIGRSKSFPVAIPIAALVGGLAMVGGGSSNGATPRSEAPLDLVPEPASMAMLALGAGALFSKIRKSA